MVENSTFRSRVVQLLQRSRRALRLYSSVSKTSSTGVKEFAEVQAEEWKVTNAILVRELSALLDRPAQKELITGLQALTDRLEVESGAVETELRLKQTALFFAAENGDYVRAALVSQELVALKARLQSRQAAHHEVADVLGAQRVIQTGAIHEEQSLGGPERKSRWNYPELTKNVAKSTDRRMTETRNTQTRNTEKQSTDKNSEKFSSTEQHSTSEARELHSLQNVIPLRRRL